MIKISYCLSEKDRITFKTKKYSATAIYCGAGREPKIELKNIGSSEVSFKSFLKYSAFLLAVFAAPALITTFVIIPAVKDNSLDGFWYSLPIMFYLFVTIIYTLYWANKAKKAGLMNHGAEHKVISAYTKLQRVPTIEEAMRFSRINNYCSCTIYSSFLTAHLIGFIVFLCTGFVVPEILIFLAAALLSHFPPLYLLGRCVQRFITAEPEEYNIRLAIAALTVLEQLELEAIEFRENV